MTFLKAVNSALAVISYSSLDFSYVPQLDGVVLADSPDVLAREGQYHAVPMIMGNQEEDGILFSQFHEMSAPQMPLWAI